MPKPHPIVTDLRNAYEAHDHDAFAHALRRLEPLLPVECARGRACVCTTPRERALCTYQPATVMAPCVRGPACSCTTVADRARCSNLSAQPKGRL